MTSLRIRPMTRADLAFADSVRALAGWNQTLEDWQRFLATEPDGCFLAEWDGIRAGTATTTVYGPELAWIGMVLVHPDYRRRGIGRALLRHCIDYLHGRGVRCIKLDATPLGQPVYEGLGFQIEWSLARWVGRGTVTPESSPPSGLRACRPANVSSIEALDAAAFGVSRRRLLTALDESIHSAWVMESASGGLEGYGLLRPGSQALYLGPVVATSERVGIELVETLVTRGNGQPIFWDIPNANAAAVSWAGRHGFTLQRPLNRMFLGENLARGNAERQFALAGLEVG